MVRFGEARSVVKDAVVVVCCFKIGESLADLGTAQDVELSSVSSPHFTHGRVLAEDLLGEEIQASDLVEVVAV